MKILNVSDIPEICDALIRALYSLRLWETAVSRRVRCLHPSAGFVIIISIASGRAAALLSVTLFKRGSQHCTSTSGPCVSTSTFSSSPDPPPLLQEQRQDREIFAPQRGFGWRRDVIISETPEGLSKWGGATVCCRTWGGACSSLATPTLRFHRSAEQV